MTAVSEPVTMAGLQPGTPTPPKSSCTRSPASSKSASPTARVPPALRVSARLFPVRGGARPRARPGGAAGGKKEVEIAAVEPVGSYAVRLVFSDGHDTGLYSWDYLYSLGEDQGTAVAALSRAAGDGRRQPRAGRQGRRPASGAKSALEEALSADAASPHEFMNKTTALRLSGSRRRREGEASPACSARWRSATTS